MAFGNLFPVVSVASFLLLARHARPLNAPLARVARADWVALPLRLAALAVQALTQLRADRNGRTRPDRAVHRHSLQCAA